MQRQNPALTVGLFHSQTMKDIPGDRGFWRGLQEKGWFYAKRTGGNHVGTDLTEAFS